MTKQIPLDELQERARQMTLAALKEFVVPEHFKSSLTLGVQFDGDFRVFELYVPGEKPSDARVMSGPAMPFVYFVAVAPDAGHEEEELSFAM